MEIEQRPPLHSLAIRVTRGSSNNLLQVATLVRAATALEVAVDVLFEDAALCKLRKDQINVMDWSPIYKRVSAELAERLLRAEFNDLESFLQGAKEHGDHVRFWASSTTIVSEDLNLGRMVACLDAEIAPETFVGRAVKADAFVVF